MIAFIVIVTVAALILGYAFYGKFIAGQLKIDDRNVTPACEINDGMDFVPAKSSLLMGQHFSAIAAAGPIVGPILAALWFGWLPAVLWIILGSIFIGSVHDFTSLLASIRHKGASIGEVLRQYMSQTSYLLFLIFVWLTLIYVMTAFTDITARTFVSVAAQGGQGPGVAAASFLYLLLALILGVLLYKFQFNLKIATAVFLPILILIILYCADLPEPVSALLSGVSVKTWNIILLVYCFAASLLPMWLLLQPRGYLGGWFLYLTIAISLIGALFGGFGAEYPAFNVEGMKSLTNGKWLFPTLFITIACGACSGFHSIVSSGTTSKQIEKESDAKVVGYGAMLLEGLVAVLAVATVMMIPKGSPALADDPNIIYAKGIATYLGLIGVNSNVAMSFALLAFSTFVYDTLDVCTRLARYILQELLGWKSMAGAVAATLITLLVPLVFLTVSKEKAYLAAWPIFGTSNQLLASLVLLVITVWLVKSGTRAFFTFIPMVIMMTMTLWSLLLYIIPFVKAAPAFENIKINDMISGITAVVLLVMSLIIAFEAAQVLRKSKIARSGHTK